MSFLGESDAILRWGAWLGSEPYATDRIASLRRFLTSNAYAVAEEWFLRERSEEPPVLAPAGSTTVADRDCAGWWRRFAAVAIDFVLVSAIIGSTGSAQLDFSTVASKGASSATPSQRGFEFIRGPLKINDSGAYVSVGGKWVPLSPATIAAALPQIGIPFWFPVYLIVLVGLAGQSFGMMIAGLRVVTLDFRKPSIGQAIVRYAIVGLLWWLIAALSVFRRHVLLHDRWTKTRVVTVESAFARLSETPALTGVRL